MPYPQLEPVRGFCFRKEAFLPALKIKDAGKHTNHMPVAACHTLPALSFSLRSVAFALAMCISCLG